MNLDLATVPTPRVVIDRARVRANIAAMQARAPRRGRAAAAARQDAQESGHRALADRGRRRRHLLREARRGGGLRRRRHHGHPAALSRESRQRGARARAAGARHALDHRRRPRRGAAAWSRAMHGAGRRLDVLVKVDVGFHRCGIDPRLAARRRDDRERSPSCRACASCGLLSHAGHGYGARRRRTTSRRSRSDEIAILRDARRRAARRRHRGRGDQRRLDADGAIHRPAARRHRDAARQLRVLRSHAGRPRRRDRADDCAMSVVSTVVSRPSPARVIFDAGSKTLPSDGVRGFGIATGYGLVFPTSTRRIPIRRSSSSGCPRSTPSRACPPTAASQPGDRVRILPNHACVVTNLADELLLVDGRRDRRHGFRSRREGRTRDKVGASLMAALEAAHTASRRSARHGRDARVRRHDRSDRRDGARPPTSSSSAGRRSTPDWSRRSSAATSRR